MPDAQSARFPNLRNRFLLANQHTSRTNLLFASLSLSSGNVHDVVLGDGARHRMQVNMHLNVLNPLKQRGRITPAEANDTREQINSSIDLEIQS